MGRGGSPMDFHKLPRRKLQQMCKKHGIPANKTNLFMANALVEIFSAPQTSSQEAVAAAATAAPEDVSAKSQVDDPSECVTDELENTSPRKPPASPKSQVPLKEALASASKGSEKEDLPDAKKVLQFDGTGNGQPESVENAGAQQNEKAPEGQVEELKTRKEHEVTDSSECNLEMPDCVIASASVKQEKMVGGMEDPAISEPENIVGGMEDPASTDVASAVSEQENIVGGMDDPTSTDVASEQEKQFSGMDDQTSTDVVSASLEQEKTFSSMEDPASIVVASGSLEQEKTLIGMDDPDSINVASAALEQSNGSFEEVAFLEAKDEDMADVIETEMVRVPVEQQTVASGSKDSPAKDSPLVEDVEKLLQGDSAFVATVYEKEVQASILFAASAEEQKPSAAGSKQGPSAAGSKQEPSAADLEQVKISVEEKPAEKVLAQQAAFVEQVREEKSGEDEELEGPREERIPEIAMTEQGISSELSVDEVMRSPETRDAKTVCVEERGQAADDGNGQEIGDLDSMIVDHESTSANVAWKEVVQRAVRRSNHRSNYKPAPCFKKTLHARSLQRAKSRAEVLTKLRRNHTVLKPVFGKKRFMEIKMAEAAAKRRQENQVQDCGDPLTQTLEQDCDAPKTLEEVSDAPTMVTPEHETGASTLPLEQELQTQARRDAVPCSKVAMKHREKRQEQFKTPIKGKSRGKSVEFAKARGSEKRETKLRALRGISATDTAAIELYKD